MGRKGKRPLGTSAAKGYGVSSGRLEGATAKMGFGVSSGRPEGTTAEVGVWGEHRKAGRDYC